MLPRPTRESSTRSGLSLVEVAIGLTVLVVGLGAFLRAMVGSFHMTQTTQEADVAHDAVRSALERISEVDFEQVFARFNGVATDDPESPVPGDAFVVEGLPPRADDPDNAAGRFVFPMGIRGRLSENPTMPFPGMPRDLNLDGDATDEDVAEYKILPIAVVVEWAGAAGPGYVEVRTILTDR